MHDDESEDDHDHDDSGYDAKQDVDGGSHDCDSHNFIPLRYEIIKRIIKFSGGTVVWSTYRVLVWWTLLFYTNTHTRTHPLLYFVCVRSKQRQRFDLNLWGTNAKCSKHTWTFCNKHNLAVAAAEAKVSADNGLKGETEDRKQKKGADEYNSVLRASKQCVCVFFRCDVRHFIVWFNAVWYRHHAMHMCATFFMHFFCIMKCILDPRNFLQLTHPMFYVRVSLCHLRTCTCAGTFIISAHAPAFELSNSLNHCINRTTHQVDICVCVV